MAVWVAAESAGRQRPPGNSTSSRAAGLGTTALYSCFSQSSVVVDSEPIRVKQSAGCLRVLESMHKDGLLWPRETVSSCPWRTHSEHRAAQLNTQPAAVDTTPYPSSEQSADLNKFQGFSKIHSIPSVIFRLRQDGEMGNVLWGELNWWRGSGHMQ